MKKLLSQTIKSQGGFSHIVPLAIVTIFAVAGVFFLVSSRASQADIVNPNDVGLEINDVMPYSSQPPIFVSSPDGPSAASASSGNRKETLYTRNWSGVIASVGKYVSNARGEITVPYVNCKRDNQATAFWVGIGGYGGKTVQQTGFSAACVKRKGEQMHTFYIGWWEVYGAKGHPKGLYNMEIRPGQRIAASVHNLDNGGGFYMQLKNLTTGAHAGHKITCPQCDITGAEWITERMGSPQGAVPLVEFKPAVFKNLYLSDDASKGKYVPLYQRPYHPMSLLSENGKTLDIKTKLSAGSKTKSFKSVYIKH